MKISRLQIVKARLSRKLVNTVSKGINKEIL